MAWSSHSGVGGADGQSPSVVINAPTANPAQIQHNSFKIHARATAATTNFPQTPSSAPPIPILISSEPNDKGVRDIFFPPGFSSDISIPSTAITTIQQPIADFNYSSSSSPTSVAKHLLSLRPILLCPSSNSSPSAIPNKIQEHEEEPTAAASSPHPLSTPISPSNVQNEFRISQLKIEVNHDTTSSSSAVSWADLEIGFV